MMSASAGTLSTSATKRALNFSAGPACLPDSVMKTAQAEFDNWRGSGMGFMEISHRDVNGPVQSTITNAMNRIRSLLHVPDNYKILFFQGGAHAQVFVVHWQCLSRDKGECC
jgi:phosphoserine aminotransferase